MGAYLSAPITLKESEDGATSRQGHGASSMQGWRRSMEDAHIVGTEKAGATLYGVFDGHGGAEVARYVARHMAEDFPEDWSANPERSLERAISPHGRTVKAAENQPELASLKTAPRPRAPANYKVRTCVEINQQEDEEEAKRHVLRERRPSRSSSR